MDGKERLAQIRALLNENPAETSAAIIDLYKENYGGIGFLMNTLAQEQPGAFIRYALDGSRLLDAPRVLDPKVTELVSVAAATALMCEHCLKAHIDSAHSNGATWEEIFDTITVSSHICESSALSVALRSFKQTRAHRRGESATTE